MDAADARMCGQVCEGIRSKVDFIFSDYSRTAKQAGSSCNAAKILRDAKLKAACKT